MKFLVYLGAAGFAVLFATAFCFKVLALFQLDHRARVYVVIEYLVPRVKLGD